MYKIIVCYHKGIGKSVVEARRFETEEDVHIICRGLYATAVLYSNIPHMLTIYVNQKPDIIWLKADGRLFITTFKHVPYEAEIEIELQEVVTA